MVNFSFGFVIVIVMGFQLVNFDFGFEMVIVNLGVVEMANFDFRVVKVANFDLGIVEMVRVNLGVVEMANFELWVVENLGVVEMAKIDLGVIAEKVVGTRVIKVRFDLDFLRLIQIIIDWGLKIDCSDFDFIRITNFKAFSQEE